MVEDSKVIATRLWVMDLDTGQPLFPAIGGGDGEKEELFITEGEDAGDDGETGGRAQEIQIPKHRFDEVNTKYRQTSTELERYKKLGNIEDLEKRLTQSQASGQPISEAELAQYDEQLRKIPAFKQVFDHVQSENQRRSAARAAYLDRAESKFKDFAADLGIPADNVSLTKEIQAVVAERIRHNPQLLSRFMDNDIGVIEDAYKEAASSGIIGFLRRNRNGKLQSVKTAGPRQPVNPKAAGPKPAERKPMTEQELLAQAAAEGYDLLRSRAEE